jgi:hypothetical protein
MDNALIKKLKNAITTSHPIEAVAEIINEYDEILKMAAWRKKIILSGKSLKRHKKELDRIAKIIEESGYYICFCDKDIDKEVRKYFRNL